MDDHLVRLAWALPLVLALGVGGLLLLKKWGQATHRQDALQGPPELLSSTPLSDHSRVMLIRHAGRQIMVFESTAAHLQVVAEAPLAGPAGGPDMALTHWGTAMRRPGG